MLRALHAENDTLRRLIKRLTRHQSGRRSEQLTEEQLQLGLEDLEQTSAEQQAQLDAAGAGNDRQAKAATTPPAATTAHSLRICRATRWWRMPRLPRANAAAA